MKCIESTAFSGLGFVATPRCRARARGLGGLGDLVDELTPTQRNAANFTGAGLFTALGVVLYTQTSWKKLGLFSGVVGGLGLVNAIVNREPALNGLSGLETLGQLPLRTLEREKRAAAGMVVDIKNLQKELQQEADEDPDTAIRIQQLRLMELEALRLQRDADEAAERRQTEQSRAVVDPTDYPGAPKLSFNPMYLYGGFAVAVGLWFLSRRKV